MEIRPPKVEDRSVLTSKSAINLMQNAGLIIACSMFIVNIFLSKSMQDIWGFINTQQVQIHMMVLMVSTTVPWNVYQFNALIGQFAQKDVYPTDEIYGVLNLTESESEFDHFEDLGYEGANYLFLSGSLLINVLLALLFYFCNHTQKYFARKLYRFEIVRQHAKQNESSRILDSIIELFKSGFMETLICVVLSLRGIWAQDLNQTGADNFTIVFVMISLISLAGLVLAITKELIENRKEFGKSQIVELRWTSNDLSQKSVGSVGFDLFFLVRRILFVMILVNLQDYLGLQLACHLTQTLVYITYILHFQPYKDHWQNVMAVLNDSSVMLTSYTLIMLCSD